MLPTCRPHVAHVHIVVWTTRATYFYILGSIGSIFRLWDYDPHLPEGYRCSQWYAARSFTNNRQHIAAHRLISQFNLKQTVSCSVNVLNYFLQENGPTNVGDEYSDPSVMNYLGARKTTMLGNNLWVLKNWVILVVNVEGKPSNLASTGR